MKWLALVAGLAVLAALLYWQLIIAEGAYLGRRMVVLLYNLSARAYDRIKQYDPGYEQWFLGLPLSRAMQLHPDPLLLDVAAGTGRLARTLFRQAGFHGRMILLDAARDMLSEAVRTTRPWAAQLTFIWQNAALLPFPDATFDGVSCLEALEFMPDPDAVLREMLRVLRPGGLLLTTNRIGKLARLLPGRTCTPEAFEERLHSLGLEMVRTQTWQEDYDLIWAVKPGVMTPIPPRTLETLLRCPRCGAAMHQEEGAFVCENAHRAPLAADGVIELARV